MPPEGIDCLLAPGIITSGEKGNSYPWREPDRPLEERTASLLDPLGRSPGPDRPHLDAAAFVARACAALAVSVAVLSDTRKDRERSEVRYLLGGLAIERWRIRSGELAAVIGRRSEVISRWAALAGTLRASDPAFRRKYESLDLALAGLEPTRRAQRPSRALGLAP
jgi:hypothetical protein